MTTLLRRWLLTLLALLMLGTAGSFPAMPAQADVGVERVSRSAGVVGDPVNLTVGCGFCFPPCEGASGRRDGPCMLDTKAQPPTSFPISLVPVAKAPPLHRCGPNALCPPHSSAPPARPPFTFLGQATPPDRDESPGGKQVPRYRLHFEVPDLRPGLYTYVIYCDTCLKGRGGSLIAFPQDRGSQLRIRPSSRNQP